MKTKIIIYSIFCLLALVGCSKAVLQPTADIQEQMKPAENIKQGNKDLLLDQEMKGLFQKFLTIDQESILMLNQQPAKINRDYWEAYKNYQEKTYEILGQYLSEDMKKKLNKQYLHNDFHYPRLLELNDYMVREINELEDVTIVTRDDDNKNYHVFITAKANVIDLEWANENYRWDEDKGYYVSPPEDVLKMMPADDQIKIGLNYWVTLDQGDDFKLRSIQEKSRIYLTTDQDKSAKNNYFVSRVPYLDQVASQDKEKIYGFLEIFMKQSYPYYHYYRRAYDTNYDVFKMAFLNDLGLTKFVKLKEENYQLCFKPAIIPLKDNIESICFTSSQDVMIRPHISASDKYHAYEVTLNAELTLINGEVRTDEYLYLFTFDNDMIYSVRFLTQNEKAAKEETKQDVSNFLSRYVY